jgi:choline dehydrogenase-like flavoprotein
VRSDFDVCIIGSGAGGGPVAQVLAAAGRRVVVLEKGPWLKEGDFFKDELAVNRRGAYTPDKRLEPQVVESLGEEGWHARPTTNTNWDFWNGALVGGSSNLMSGFFHRQKPQDFRLRSEFGPIEGASVEDWPISYDDLEPWYALAEHEVGVSGRVSEHPLADRRSTAAFPLPPLDEHPISGWLDQTCAAMGLHSIPVPRAILSRPSAGRAVCSYTGICAEYGCATGAKGSARAAFLDRAVATGRCEIRPRSAAQRIATDASGQITHVEYRDAEGRLQRVDAKVYVVACQAIETARLLLLSTGPKHQRGLGNGAGLVGQNLLFSTAAWARGDLSSRQGGRSRTDLLNTAPWINRAVQDFYFLPGEPRRKGGTLEFMLAHPQAISRAISAASSPKGMLWGLGLKRRLEERFHEEKQVLVEVFADWLPNPDCHVTLDPEVKDRFGVPVARVKIGKHPRNEEVATAVLDKGVAILERLGCTNLVASSRGAPSTNLVGGTCRFGRDPGRSVLAPDCRMHEVENLFVTDGSFLPTGGSVPFTFTLYANALRVAQAVAASV